MATDVRFGYTFPAIRGVQAGREYYVSVCPMRLIPRLFLFDEEEAELPPELRAQRILNRARVPEIAAYICNNSDNYVFSALTASIDGDVRFEPLANDGHASLVGLLHAPLDARFIINDGQHRRAAIEEAVRKNPEIGDESIGVVFFIDRDLSRCQQMFADLNRHSVRPAKSLGVLYDHRDSLAQIVRLTVIRSRLFNGLVEMERSTLSRRSRRLFTLSAIYTATKELLENSEFPSNEEAASVATQFWESVAEHIPEWSLVKAGSISAGEIRRDFIHSHGIALHAVGRVGRSLIGRKTADQKKLEKLGKVDWSRSNPDWEGRALIGGRVSKADQNVTLTANYLKRKLGLTLTPEEEKAERAFLGAAEGRRA